ncbi:MAG: hypothetical protein HKP09_10075 [Enterobacterales bacterium]|nr:hypothetical protein [Enterobacterales bacterium]
MKYLSRYFVICLLFASAHIHAEEEPSIRVLFVGNSYTYYWNMPLAVTLMAESLGKNIYTKQSTEGNTTLEHHWKGEMETQTKVFIEQGNWDYIVFNNHSLSPQDIPEKFKEYSLKFADLAKQNGAQPVFYMTWARKHNRLMQPKISKAYREIMQESGADLVPIGEIWMKSIDYHPEKNLYAIDDSHPSPLGTYLTALAFTKYFTGDSVQAVPNQLYINDANGDKLYIAMMLGENAEFFRDLVDTWNIKNTKKD